MTTIKKIIGVFIAGAIVGSICDLFHVINHITYYNHPNFLMQAWWVPFIFGFAAVAIVTSHVYLDQALKRELPELSWRRVVYGVLGFVFLYFMSGYWPATGLYKAIVMTYGALTIWYIFDKTAYGLAYGCMVALIGTCIEIMLVNTGLFYYTVGEMIGVAYWLPCLYIAASVAVGNLGRKMFAEKITLVQQNIQNKAA